MARTKYIFVSGGVLSGLGKGLLAASLGSLLKKHGYKIGSLKCENYLNVDSGTINPIEHGDPFLCEDGLEADMDLGTYERILNQEMGQVNFVTMGQLYKTVIDRERDMGYEGEDVEAIPHVTDEIITRIEQAGKGNDITIIELGGSVEDYMNNNALYYEACRMIKQKYPSRVVNIHVTYVPIPKTIGEPKTKPTQTSVRTFMSMGIQPEFLVLRCEEDMDKRRRYVLGLKTGIDGENVIMAKDLDCIYELPIYLKEQELDTKVLKVLKLPSKKINLTDWKKLIKNMTSNKTKSVTIAIAGKYLSKNKGDFELNDSYHALIESLHHAAYSSDININLKMVSTIDIEDKGTNALKGVDGIIVPIGWGKRGVEGKIKVIEYARKNKIPYLGLCYGMQLAAVEFARHVAGLNDAHTEEVKKTAKNKIIHSIPFNKKYQVIKGKGTSMRLGGYDCVLKEGTLAHEIYEKHNGWKDKKKNIISERHRHRFEFNNEYREILEKHGLIISGTSPDNFFVEMIELPKNMHPFFIATQAHPEYKSTPLKPHPMFIEFLKAAVK